MENELTREIQQREQRIKELTNELFSLKNKEQPSIEDLYNGITEYFHVVVDETTSKVLTRGDGRSRGYNQTFKGVADVSIATKYYLSLSQRKIIEYYIRSVYDVEYVEFIN